MNYQFKLKEKIKEYHNARIHELPPHIYALAECAYSNVCNESEDQAVIISGESGAGKSVWKKNNNNYCYKT